MSSATSESDEELSLEESLLVCSRRGQTRILEDILQSRKDGTIHVDINCKGLLSYLLCTCLYIFWTALQVSTEYMIVKGVPQMRLKLMVIPQQIVYIYLIHVGIHRLIWWWYPVNISPLLSTVCLGVICSLKCTTLLVIRTFYSPHAYFCTKVSVHFHAVCQETRRPTVAGHPFTWPPTLATWTLSNSWCR